MDWPSPPPPSRQHGMMAASALSSGAAAHSSSTSTTVVDIDLDATLPFPMDMSYERRDVNDDFEVECHRLLEALLSNHPLLEDDVASLLLRLTTLRIGRDDD